MKRLLNIILALSMALTILVIPNTKMIKANDGNIPALASILPISGYETHSESPGGGHSLKIRVDVQGTADYNSIDGYSNPNITKITPKCSYSNGVYAANFSIVGYTTSVTNTSVIVRVTVMYDVFVTSNGNLLVSAKTATITASCT